MAFNIIMVTLFFIVPGLVLAWLFAIFASGNCIQFIMFAVPEKMIPQMCGYQLFYLMIPIFVFMFGTGLVLALWNDFNVWIEFKSLVKRMKRNKPKGT